MSYPASPSDEVTQVPLLDVARSNEPLKDQIIQAWSDLYDSGRFIGGPVCAEFEHSMAEYCQAEFAIGCASGSDALLLALMAIGIQPGDEVICPSFTFFATASAISRLGARPVFVDIDPGSFNMTANQIQGAITSRTRAIIPVHLFGQCCDMQPIVDIARENNLYVIEDAAQAIGATDGTRPAGSIGDIGCFSFYPTKNLGGMGDGGILTTQNETLADRIRLLANHGMQPRYYHREIGINSRLDALQAVALNIKLRHLPWWVAQRTENADRYRRLAMESGLISDIQFPVARTDGIHVWNQYSIRVPAAWRDSIRQFLADRNVGTEIYYPVPLHRQACFADLNVDPNGLPQTERAAEEVIALPIFPGLTEAEQQYVITSLVEAVAAQKTRLRMAS